MRKDIFTWFWVRSSLPKKLWKKCMDYEVKLDNGKSIWYKLVGHDVIPVLVFYLFLLFLPCLHDMIISAYMLSWIHSNYMEHAPRVFHI